MKDKSTRWRHIDYRTELDNKIKEFLATKTAADLGITTKSELMRRIWQVIKGRLEDIPEAYLQQAASGDYRQADIEPEIAEDIDEFINSIAGKTLGLTEKPDLFVPVLRSILTESSVEYRKLASTIDVSIDDLKKTKPEPENNRRRPGRSRTH